MSIVASVKVNDGLVLAAESMAQIWGVDAEGNAQVLKTYQHAQKLFQMGELPLGIMTYGMGNIGSRSVGSLITEFAREVSRSTPVEDIAKSLLGFLKDVHQKNFGSLPLEKQPSLGIFMGGYSPNSPLAEEWEFGVPASDAPKVVRNSHGFGASWRGVGGPFTRLYRGIDSNFRKELVNAGIKEEDTRSLQNKYTAPIMFENMPLQDAIDFAAFILQTTINMARFEIGTPSCGGPKWIAVIVRETGFTWIEKPKLEVGKEI